MFTMRVSKWGEGLAVCLPTRLVEALDLKVGDEIELTMSVKRKVKVTRDQSKDWALEQLRQMNWSFPEDFKFNRQEVNEP